jgi:hypothetical protein
MLEICAQYISGDFNLLGFVKEKSWSVRLTGGYVLNGQVRANHCVGCEATTKLIAGNNSDPDLVLYGCNGHKCRHKLIRVNLNPENTPNFSIIKPIENLQIIPPN